MVARYGGDLGAFNQELSRGASRVDQEFLDAFRERGKSLASKKK